MSYIADLPYVGWVIPFLLVLGVVVFVHEYGHYIVGKWCGIKADVFSMGVMLFAMLTGVYPFKAPSSSDPRFRMLEKGHLRKLLTTLPPDVVKISPMWSSSAPSDCTQVNDNGVSGTQ